MAVTIEEHATHSSLSLVDAVDLEQAHKLHELALRCAARALDVEVTVDCGHAHTSAFQVLMALERSLSSHGHTLQIVAASPAARSVVELAGMKAISR